MTKTFKVIALLLTISISCQALAQLDELKELKTEPVIIRGKIENFHSEFKTASISYFDAITRSVNEEVFVIDSLGCFEVTFPIIHEVYGCINLVIQNNWYNIYVEPQKSYDIVLNNGDLKFINEGNPISDELYLFETALNNQFQSEIQRARTAHNEKISIDEYLAIQKEVEKKKLEFLDSYTTDHSLKSKTIEILKNNIRYETARAWICMRYDYSTGRPVLRDSLPEEFYKKLFSEYPINSNNGYMTREYIDYISNIGNVMDKVENTKAEERINFYKTFHLFSDEDLKLLYRVYCEDTTVYQTEAFKAFRSNDDKLKQERKLRNIFAMKNILANISRFPKSLGRDLILSQQITRRYLDFGHLPSEKEWEEYRDYFYNISILDYLMSVALPVEKKVSVDHAIAMDNPTKEYIQTIEEKYFKPNLGKVIYVDFWATWCSPCKEEIPYAKMLHAELKNKDIVFLNFCVKSDRGAWEKMITQQKIEGENYLLNEDEFNILTRKFKVKGFPTYILIGKDGTVINYSAERPSSGQQILKQINSLLQ